MARLGGGRSSPAAGEENTWPNGSAPETVCAPDHPARCASRSSPVPRSPCSRRRAPAPRPARASRSRSPVRRASPISPLARPPPRAAECSRLSLPSRLRAACRCRRRAKSARPARRREPRVARITRRLRGPERRVGPFGSGGAARREPAGRLELPGPRRQRRHHSTGHDGCGRTEPPGDDAQLAGAHPEQVRRNPRHRFSLDFLHERHRSERQPVRSARDLRLALRALDRGRRCECRVDDREGLLRGLRDERPDRHLALLFDRRRCGRHELGRLSRTRRELDLDRAHEQHVHECGEWLRRREDVGRRQVDGARRRGAHPDDLLAGLRHRGRQARLRDAAGADLRRCGDLALPARQQRLLGERHAPPAALEADRYGGRAELVGGRRLRVLRLRSLRRGEQVLVQRARRGSAGTGVDLQRRYQRRGRLRDAGGLHGRRRVSPHRRGRVPDRRQSGAAQRQALGDA